MINFNNPYNRTDFLRFLEEQFLPDDFRIDQTELEDLGFSARYTVKSHKLGTCRSLELDVFEITHTSTHDARVGIAQDAFRLMLHKSYYNRALVIFKQEDNPQYRFSLLQIEAEQAETSSRITRSFSNPRRYSFLLGEGAHVKTPTQFLIEDGKLTTKNGTYFEDLQKRFSVEVLTKLFYKELSDWYFWALKQVEFPNCIDDDNDDKIYNPENVIRLITRLIFVWFLKQKELVKSDFFEIDKLSKILENFEPESENQSIYYKAILQNLFFATLNQEIGKRGFAENKNFHENKNNNYNIKNLYRYEDLFTNKDTTEIMKLFSQVPFLNGGLFECLDEKKIEEKTYYWDGFSRIKKRQAIVPNHLFFSKEQTVDLSSEYNNSTMRAVKVSGIIEILQRYNFTIEENTPTEIQVALDPELLGKVFENLLGAYNPETKETARNQTGSFYTPREIVNFMVNESLLAYYTSQIPYISEEKIRPLFNYEQKEIELNETERKALIKATFNCKILDPACGSGAYPMGILQQLVHVLAQLDPYNDYWQDLVIEQALEAVDKAENSTTEDKQEIINDIYLSFDKKVNYPDYARKLYLIENSIYGADIQSIAVQISKLRFFISLVCEQNPTSDANTNFGIRPLPNLETKFVSANTLIAIEKPNEDMQYIKNDQINKLIDKLRDIRRKQFSVTGVADKAKLRRKDEQIREDIVNEVERLYKRHADENLNAYQKELDKCIFELDLYTKKSDDIRVTTETDLFGNTKETTINVTENKRKDLTARKKRLEAIVEKGSDYSRLNSVVKLAKQLTKWNPYDQNQSNKFFDPEWMFGVENGFDVVIGNPPYVQLQNNGGNLAKMYQACNYQTFARTGDIYCLFYERGWQLLKECGHLCYITSNKWMRAGYGEATRKFFAENTNPKQLIDFGGVKVFESATVDTNILLFAKEKNTFKTQACVVKDKQLKNLSVYFRQNVHTSSFSNSESWVVLSEIEQRIKAKIEAVGTPLKDWDIQIYRGVLTGYNEAFIINGDKKEEILANCKDNAERERTDEIIRPILRGRDIKRYSYEFADLYLLFIPWHFPLHNDPTISGASEVAEKEFENQYPAIYNHLFKYKKQLSNRNKAETGIRYEWYALQRWGANYWEDFYKQKIAWNRIASEKQFALIEKGVFIQDSMHFFTGNHLQFLSAILNSKLYSWFLNLIVGEAAGGNAGNADNIKNLKVPLPNVEFEKEVLRLLKNNSYTDLDNQIYNIFYLSKIEIEQIESV